MIQLQKLITLLIFLGFCVAYADKENPFAQFAQKHQSSSGYSDLEDNFDNEEDEKGLIAWCKRHYVVTSTIIAAGVAGAVLCNDKNLLSQVMKFMSDVKSNTSDFSNALFGKKEEKLVKQQNNTLLPTQELHSQNSLSPKDTSESKTDPSESKTDPLPLQPSSVTVNTPLLLSTQTKEHIDTLHNLIPNVMSFIQNRVILANMQLIQAQKDYREENISSALIEQMGNALTELQSEYQNNYLKFLDPNERNAEFKYLHRIDKLFHNGIAVCDLNKNGKMSKKNTVVEMIAIFDKIKDTTQKLSQYAPTTKKLTNGEFTLLTACTLAVVAGFSFLCVSLKIN